MGKHLRAVVLVAVILALQVGVGAAEKVSARTEKAVIPTFEIGKGNPSPVIFNNDSAGAYPRSMLDVGTRAKEPTDKEYDLAVVENQYLRVEVLPAVGGRVWRIIDKKTGRNLLWTNDAVKPVRVGRRGGWIAGGIEFPFPVGNHGEDTIEPYRSAVRQNEDGSATITVSNFDHFYRFWGSYDMTLSPGEARLAITVRLYNPTLVRNRYQLWINAAVPAGMDMQFVFPVDWVSGHGFGGVHPWPMWDDGKLDRSFWKNQEDQLGVFGWNADYMAAYYYSTNHGIVRYCPHSLAEGIKLWTWGTDSDWAQEYAVNQGPYCEIQSGRWPTQEMYRWLEPHQTDTWTEYWYPVRYLWGVGGASKDAAMNVLYAFKRGKPSTAEIRLEVLRPVTGTLRASLGDRQLFEKGVALTPDDFVRETVSIAGAKPDDTLSVSLRDKEGFVVISYESQIERKPGPKPEAPARFEAEGDTAAWKELTSGLEAELNEGDPAKAREVYANLVRANADFAPAWKALGILALKQNEPSVAEEALSKAAGLAAGDAEARYYLALAKLDLKRADALDVMKSVEGDVRFTHLAKFVLGLEALKSGDYRTAAGALKEAGRGWSADAILWDYLAVAARLAGDTDSAKEALDAALAAEPLDPFAAVERLVASGTASGEALRTALGADDDLYIETALFYDGINQSRTALEVAQAGKDLASSGLYFDHLATLAVRAGEEALAGEFAAKAASMGTDYVFPHRREDIAVLDAAAKASSRAGFSEYHKGVLFYWLGRANEAIDMWTGLLGRYEVPGLRRKIADAYSRGKLTRDIDSSVDMYRKALEEDPKDVEIYYALDDLYQYGRSNRQRGELLEKGRKLFPEDDQMLLRMARFLVRRNKAADAAKLIEGHTFHKAHQSFQLAHIGEQAVEEVYTSLAMDAMREGKKRQAVKYLEKAAKAEETARQWFD